MAGKKKVTRKKPVRVTSKPVSEGWIEGVTRAPDGPRSTNRRTAEIEVPGQPIRKASKKTFKPAQAKKK